MVLGSFDYRLVCIVHVQIAAASGDLSLRPCQIHMTSHDHVGPAPVTSGCEESLWLNYSAQGTFGGSWRFSSSCMLSSHDESQWDPCENLPAESLADSCWNLVYWILYTIHLAPYNVTSPSLCQVLSTGTKIKFSTISKKHKSGG